ncbi:MAG TPA: hypothetical protein VFF29_07250 [Bacteroidota bacterium]|nr:hypothetical protein [Bacteroidota bacterium]
MKTTDFTSYRCITCMSYVVYVMDAITWVPPAIRGLGWKGIMQAHLNTPACRNAAL